MARLDRRGLDAADPGLARGRPPVPRDLPRAPAPVRAERRGRRGDARCPGRSDGPARGCADAPHIGWNQVERSREHPLFDGIADGADFYFVHSYAGAPGPPIERRRPRHDRARRAGSSRPSPGARSSASSSIPERSGRDGLRLLANFVDLVAGGLMLRRRVIPCLDVADGRVVKGTRFVDLVDEGDPPELAERYAAEGADELGLPRHHGSAPSAAARCSTSSSAPRGGRSSR